MTYYIGFSPPTELAHSGIKGMQKGKRRFQNLDGSLTDEGFLRYYGHRRGEGRNKAKLAADEVETRSFGRTRGEGRNKAKIAVDEIETKTPSKEGSSFAVNPKNGNIEGQKKLDAYFHERKSNGTIDPKTGFYKKSVYTSPDEDMATINPAYDAWKGVYNQNCAKCSVAYDLRRRGYDVVACPSPEPLTTDEILRWYPGGEFHDFQADAIKKYKEKKNIPESRSLNFLQMMSVQRMTYQMECDAFYAQPEGARGSLLVLWSNGAGGHSMAYEVVNGGMVVRDCQANTKYTGSDLQNILQYYVSDLNFIRYDNLEPDFKYIKEHGICE